MLGVTVCVCTIPPRRELLRRALRSIADQTLLPDAILVVADEDREGAPATRDRALARVGTEWVAFLDDDDEMLPCHLECLHGTAVETGADLVYPWFEAVGGPDPIADYFGRPWDDAAPHVVPITTLARTESLRRAGGFAGVPPPQSPGHGTGEDEWLVWRLMGNGARIVHLPERTWRWHQHGANTSGRPDRW
jgi:hypothetical protein